MKRSIRVIRFSVALVVAGVLATQIPMNGGTALARDGYGGRGGSGTTGRNLIRAGVGLAVGYGLLSTITSPPTGGGGGGGGGELPPPPQEQNNETPTETAWGILNGRDDLNQFAKLAEQAGLKDELDKKNTKDVPQMTLFVPNNAAFADLGADKLSALTADTPEAKTKLADLLNSHIIKGKYTIDQLKAEVKGLADGKSYPTLNGKAVTIKLAGDVLTINNVRIIESDITAGNGIIHPIGQVLDSAPPANATP